MLDIWSPRRASALLVVAGPPPTAANQARESCTHNNTTATTASRAGTSPHPDTTAGTSMSGATTVSATRDTWCPRAANTAKTTAITARTAAAASPHCNVSSTSSVRTPAVNSNRASWLSTSLRTAADSTCDDPYRLSAQTAADDTPASTHARLTDRGRGGAVVRDCDMPPSHHAGHGGWRCRGRRFRWVGCESDTSTALQRPGSAGFAAHPAKLPASAGGFDLQAVGVGVDVDADGGAVGDAAGEQGLGQPVADGALDQSPQRSGTVRRVEAGEGQPLARRVGDLERDPPRAASRAARASTWRSTMRASSSAPSGSKSTTSSSRLRNSGLNSSRTTAITASRVTSSSSVWSTRAPTPGWTSSPG